MLKAKRLRNMFELLVACTVTATGFTSQAASRQPEVTTITDTKEEDTNTHAAAVAISQDLIASTQEMAQEQQQIIEEKIAAREAQEAYVRQNQELMASIIFCEAGNQSYEGQVAVGAVIMNRVKSGTFPNTIEGVIYQSGQFSPVATGWLNKVRNSAGYTQTAMQAAIDALNGSNPIGSCLYFDQGGSGMKIGAHYFH